MFPSINLVEDTESDSDESKLVNENVYLTPVLKNKVSFQNPTNDMCEDNVKKNENQQDQTFFTNKWVALESHAARLHIYKETSSDTRCPEEMDELFSRCISATDILIAVYSDHDELGKVLQQSGGVMGYVRKYWMGFFPLLLIHLTKPSTCEPVNELDSCLLANQFSFTHRVIIQDISSDKNFLLRTIAQYHLHVHQLQCSRLQAVLFPAVLGI